MIVREPLTSPAQIRTLSQDNHLDTAHVLGSYSPLLQIVQASQSAVRNRYQAASCRYPFFTLKRSPNFRSTGIVTRDQTGIAVAPRNRKLFTKGMKLMNSKTRSRKPIAAMVAIAIFSVYSMVVLASPSAKALSGELSVVGQVTLNGELVVYGATVFSDNVITTAEKSTAIVNLSKLGRVELAPRSDLKLSFSDKGVEGLLENGTAHISTLAGTTVNFTTTDGVVVIDGSQATSVTVDVVEGVTSLTTTSGIAQLHVGGAVKVVAAGERVNSTPQTDDDDDDMSGGALAVLLLAVGGAVAAVLYAALHDNDLNFGGSVTVVSPTK
jgi:hypothetical protein